MSRNVKIVIVVLLLVSVAMLPVACAGKPVSAGEFLLDGLGAPRGISVDADGNLLVAVAGTGGEMKMTLPGPEGETEMGLGLSGSILSVAPDGTTSVVMGGFPSYASPQETTGVYRIIPHGDSLWLLFSGSGAAVTGGFWMDSIVEYDPATLIVRNVINLQDFEAQNDPDGNGYDSNVSDIAWGADGTMYITDAGGNSLLSWTEEDGLAVVAAWPENPVPTSVEIAENGDFYIGFLGAGLAPGAGAIEHWSNGELVETFAGLTTVTDILLDGDTLYAVQMFQFGDQGPGPGNVVTVNADGATVVQGDLPAPFGIAKAGDGSFYVTTGTIVMGPDQSGGIYHIFQ